MLCKKGILLLLDNYAEVENQNLSFLGVATKMSVRNDKPCLHQQGPTQVYVTMGTYLYTKTNKFQSVHSCRNYNMHIIVGLQDLYHNIQEVSTYRY